MFGIVGLMELPIDQQKLAILIKASSISNPSLAFLICQLRYPSVSATQ